MKRFFTILLAAVMLTGFYIPAARAAEDNLPAAPTLYIERNRLKMDGNTLTMGEVLKYDAAFISRLDAAAFNPVTADVPDLDELKVAFVMGMINPNDVRGGSLLIGSGLPITVYPGDFIMLRRKASGSTPAGHWKIIKLTEAMLAYSTASTAADLPGLSVTATGLTVTPKNAYTPYEYAVFPKERPQGFTPDWIPLGEAISSADGKTLTGSFRARSTEYTIRVRVEGDDKQGYLYAEAAGIPVTTPILSLSGEYIGPLSGSGEGTVWYLSTDGGKRWTATAVEPGDDAYLDMYRVFGKKEVAIQLRKADRALDEDGNLTEPPPESAAVVLQTTVNPRPVFPKDAKPTGYVNAASPQNWTLTGSAPKQLEYMPEGGANWLPFSTDVGLPLLTAEEQASGRKPVKVLLRVPAQESSRTPASVPKKFTQQKQVKAPSFKPDYRSETIRCKAGTYYYAGPEIPIDTAVFKAAGDSINISEALNKGYILYLYTANSGGKSRSAVQTIRLAARAPMPDLGEGVIVEKDKFKLEKGFEYSGSKVKWGSLTKGDAKGSIRRKATAKYNPKTNTNTGLAASKPVEVKFTYSADGKKAVSLDMPSRKPLTLDFLNPSGFTNSAMAYYSNYSPELELFLTLSWADATAGFNIKPQLPEKDGFPLVEEIIVKNGDTVVEPTDGVYKFTGITLGTVCTITLKPKDPETYRATQYTITAILPLAASLSSVSFGTKNGDRGIIRVTLRSALQFGDNRILSLQLFKLAGSNADVIHSLEQTLSFDATQQGKLVYEFDLRAIIAAAGPGTYSIQARTVGVPGATSDSEASTALLSLTAANLGPALITLSEPADRLHPAVGDVYTVTAVSDMLGNDLLAGAAYQWYRVTRTDPADPATAPQPAAIHSGIVIHPDGSGGSYTVTAADRGFALEVEVFARGVVGRATAYRKVS